jgi:hypothetical protein
MSFWNRILIVALLFAGATMLVNKETRGFTGALAANAYTLVAGTPVPLPLERPPFLARAELDDCLRGVGEVEGSDVYAAFCEDLANLTATAPSTPSQPEPAQAPVKKADQINETTCTSLSNAPDGMIAVSRHCRVESPVSGIVLYADHFKGYRGIVILETTKGARVTLAGLAEVRVARGDKAARGDVLGTTPAKTAPALADAAGEDEGPALLYMTDRTSGAKAARPAS